MPDAVTIAIVLLIVVIIHQHYQLYVIHAELDNIINSHNGLTEATAEMLSDILTELDNKEDKDYGN